MKSEIVTYEFGSFTDFKGIERMVIGCAVSQSVEKGLNASWASSYDVFPIIRAVHVGIAVYNPNDEFDLAFGKETAYKKALANNPSIFIPEGGVFSQGMAVELLKKSIINFATRPSSVIKGYKEAEAKYLKIKASEEAINQMPDEYEGIIQTMLKGVDVENIVKQAKPYVEALKNDSSLVD